MSTKSRSLPGQALIKTPMLRPSIQDYIMSMKPRRASSLARLNEYLKPLNASKTPINRSTSKPIEYKVINNTPGISEPAQKYFQKGQKRKVNRKIRVKRTKQQRKTVRKTNLKLRRLAAKRMRDSKGRFI